MLGFLAGSEPEIVLCTGLCHSEGPATAACEQILSSWQVEAEFAEPPPPPALLKPLLLAAEQPLPSLICLSAVAIVLVGVWLWRRPRPARW